MKLRIQDDSLRFRLTRNEVARLSEVGLVESAIRFPATRTLRYSVTSGPDAAGVSVSYADDSIQVILPHAAVATWAASIGEIAIKGIDSGVRILVEKDFQCLHQPLERDPEAYPNPLAG